jgi:hypothetical protein
MKLTPIQMTHTKSDQTPGRGAHASLATIKNDSCGSFLEGRRTGNSCPAVSLFANTV